MTSAEARDYVEGRRTFFKYRDLGVAAASNGWMRAPVMTVVTGMTVSVTFAMVETEFAEASQVVKIISGEIEPP